MRLQQARLRRRRAASRSGAACCPWCTAGRSWPDARDRRARRRSRSPSVSMITPQPTPQYGQVERVSRASLPPAVRIAARRRHRRDQASRDRRCTPAVARAYGVGARRGTSAHGVRELARASRQHARRPRPAPRSAVAQPIVRRARRSRRPARSSSCAAGRPRCSPNTMPWRQRAALVRAAIEQREHAVVGGAEHGDVAAARARARGARRAPGCRRRGRSSSSRSSHRAPQIGDQRRRTGARRPRALSSSNHGSGSPSSANCSRSHSALRFAASSSTRLLDVVEADARDRSAPCARGTSLPRDRAAGTRPQYSITSVVRLAPCTKNCATSVLMPPLPPT